MTRILTPSMMAHAAAYIFLLFISVHGEHVEMPEVHRHHARRVHASISR